MSAIEPNDQTPTSAEATQASDAEDFDALLDQYLGETSNVQTGTLTKAVIVDIQGDSVLLDIGDKAEGVAPLRDFQDFKGQVSVKAGDEVEIVIERRDSETGQIHVSHRKARQRHELARIQEAKDNNFTVHCYVEKVVKDGLLVNCGIPCFLPGSQVSLQRTDNLQQYVGKELEVYVLEVDQKRRRGVVSHRKFLQEQQQSKRGEFLATLEENTFIEGRVKNAVEFGVFIDLGAMDGLVPRDEISWEKRFDVAEVLKPGVRYKFKVLSVDRERGRITLSRRQTKPDPWASIQADYPVDATVTGKVVGVTNNCAYVEIGEGIEGRIQRENLSWLPTVRRPSDVIHVGDEIKAVVLGHVNDRRLLELGLKQIEKDPWDDIDQRFPVGSRQNVKVLDFMPFGAFVELDAVTKGLIHVSDLSYDQSVRDAKKVLEAGAQIEAVVLKIDKQARKINLGVKQLTDDPFESFVRSHPNNSLVTGTVKEVTDILAIVDLGPLVDGRIHVSEWDRDRIDKISNVVKVGDEVTAKIIKIEKKERRISLSRKKALQDEERKAIEEYKKASPVKATTNLGDLLKGMKLGGGEG